MQSPVATTLLFERKNSFQCIPGLQAKKVILQPLGAGIQTNRLGHGSLFIQPKEAPGDMKPLPKWEGSHHAMNSFGVALYTAVSVLSAGSGFWAVSEYGLAPLCEPQLIFIRLKRILRTRPGPVSQSYNTSLFACSHGRTTLIPLYSALWNKLETMDHQLSQAAHTMVG